MPTFFYDMRSELNLPFCFSYEFKRFGSQIFKSAKS